jgi:hypothetical protein
LLLPLPNSLPSRPPAPPLRDFSAELLLVGRGGSWLGYAAGEPDADRYEAAAPPAPGAAAVLEEPRARASSSAWSWRASLASSDSSVSFEKGFFLVSVGAGWLPCR